MDKRAIAVILAAETLLRNMPAPRSRARMAEWQALSDALAAAHPRVPHGPCNICGHYGDDCTGSKAPPYQPKTGAACSCAPGIARDNCPQCEGTGQRIDFAAIRARK